MRLTVKIGVWSKKIGRLKIGKMSYFRMKPELAYDQTNGEFAFKEVDGDKLGSELPDVTVTTK